MAMSDFTIKLKSELEVGEDSAEIALKVVNLYCNQNNLMIKETPFKDRIGVRMEFVQRPYDYYAKESKK